MNKKDSVRIDLGTFDLIKGITMIFIVTGHMLYYYQIDQTPLSILFPPVLMYMWHLGGNTMLFTISGFRFRPKSFSKTLKQTFSDLIVPYLWVTLFIAILFPICHFLTYHWWPGAITEGIRYTLAFLFGVPNDGYETVLFGYALYECSVVHFLMTLFWALNLLNLILRIKDRRIQWLAVASCVALSFTLAHFHFTYFCLPRGLLTTLTCYLGYQIKQNRWVDRIRSHRWIYLVLAAIGAYAVFIKAKTLLDGNFSHMLIGNLGGISIGLLLFFFGIAIGNLDWHWLDGIRKIGIHTYWIMCLHSVEMTVIPWYYWSERMSEHQTIAFFVELAIKAMIYIVGCIVLNRIARFKYRRKLRHV